jgi:hypothetical protein
MAIPLLILAFQNPEALKARVQEAISLGLFPIYISIDGLEGKDFSSEVRERQNSCVSIANQYKLSNTIMGVKTLKENLGQAVAIPNAIDWFFSFVEAGIILEEDCRLDISVDFQDALNLFPLTLQDTDISAICLSNLWPPKLLEKLGLSSSVNFIESQFFNSWGWYTCRRNWNEFARKGDERQILLESVRKLNVTHISKIIMFLEWRRHIKQSRKANRPTWALGFTLHLIQRGKLVAVPLRSFVVHEPSDTAVHIKERPLWALTSFDSKVNCSFQSLNVEGCNDILERFTAQNVHGASAKRYIVGLSRRALIFLKIIK